MLLTALLLTCLAVPLSGQAETVNPAAVTALLDRIGGQGTSERFVTVVDETLSEGGKDVFVITARDGKPCIKGSSVIAVTTGINWYLNHHARVNLAWNNLTTDLGSVSLPVPATEERRKCEADYRYYLNYCTFSYSMSTWTWERWQQEIDWMALHGINMPLQIVGLDAVWYKLLTEKYGYTHAEADKFVAGPCFQAWWGMNNLQGWGGPNPEWWYKRQETLCRNILARQRELGMQPVLPGYSGMVPSDFTAKTGHAANSQGNWCGFVRPYILDPNGTAFTQVAADYYATLEELMGTSVYYSMDPFHEGANTNGIDVPAAYASIAQAMYTARSDAKWVIQFWQWSGAQYNVLDKVEKGRLIVLDLFSDAHTHFGAYKGHDAVWCTLPNFGGRTGFMGRFNGIIDGYFSNKAQYANIKGIGATPEAIESVPVLYDLLFELPWHTAKPDAREWMKEYAASRYGKADANAETAWEKLRTSALDCRTGLQGPHEAVVCARPALTVDKVSSWGGTGIFYDPQDVADAAHRLLAAGLDGSNYSYDLTDIARQALTDYAYHLLKSINEANTNKNTEMFGLRRDAFLQLILDLDELLNTNKDFMLGRWTQMARGIADEAAGTTQTDRNWLELDNARTLITTWGDRGQANNGGLRDYSYREWGGMMKDYYYPRWKKFFDDGLASSDWFQMEWNWAHDDTKSYSDTPVGNTAEVARRLFERYFLVFPKANGESYYIYRAMATDKRADINGVAFRGTTYTCPVTLPEGTGAKLSIDYNNDGVFADGETAEGIALAIPEDAVTTDVKARLTLEDGTEFVYTLALKDEITVPRDVTVRTADATQGTATIVGTDGTTVNTTDYVSLKAIPATGYDFENWTDASGKTVSTDNPYTYYGKDSQTFTANFIVNKWGAPAEDKGDMNDIRNHSQYISSITVTQDGETNTLYETAECPSTLFNMVGKKISAARGSSFSLDWTDAGGLGYTYLSAYIDLNGDGEFNMDDELLAVKGTHGGQSSAPRSGPLDILLPYDLPTGITRIRLRFDGAWKTDYDKNTDAFPAKNTLNRMTYDIAVDVTEKSGRACTVTVVSADPARGTVDANGQPDTYTYSPDEDIVLRAYPSDGYKLDRWEDKYGRALPAEWSEGNTIRFKPYESGTYTAIFKPAELLTYEDWIFAYEEVPGGIVITSVEKNGAGPLDLTQENNLGKTLVGIVPEALRGNTTLTNLTLPAEDIALDYWIRTNFKGAGTQNAAIVPATPIPGTGPWRLRMQVSTDGSSFNQWGSGLLATGSNALADSYTNNFQFYLSKDGIITMKLNNGDNRYRFSPAVGNKFTIEMVNDGSGNFSTTLTTEDGQTDTKTQTNIRLNDITQFSTALPSGVSIDLLAVTDPTLHSQPLKGCTALTDVTVSEGNLMFSDKDGILYSADGSRLRAYPEGRLTKRHFRLRSLSDGKTAYVTPLADANGNVIDAGGTYRRVMAGASETVAAPTALWQLVSIAGGYKVEHANSQRFFGGKANEHNRVEMPVSPTQWHGTYAYDGTVTAGGEYVLTLKTGNYYVKNGGQQLVLETADVPDAAHQWIVDEAKDIPVNISDALWTSLCLPVAVTVPSADETTVYIATNVEGDAMTLAAVEEGTVLAAGEGVLVSAPAAGTVVFPLAAGTDAKKIESNLLDGATIERTRLTAGTYYGLGNKAGVGFYISTGTIVPANKAYLLASKLNGTAAPQLRFDGTATGIGTATGDGAKRNSIWYDLRGRRVLYPAHGIYVNSEGRKVFID